MRRISFKERKEQNFTQLATLTKLFVIDKHFNLKVWCLLRL